MEQTAPFVLPSATTELAGTATETSGAEGRKLFLQGLFAAYRTGQFFIAIVEMAGKFVFIAAFFADIFVNRHLDFLLLEYAYIVIYLV